jgi:ssDNA-binding Zn-finger/Zn-ribbon topoisomerase 1|tara:strand:+ start:282 stop:737 length:456 start_codon:yes stop_codon:yes gene_type:complete
MKKIITRQVSKNKNHIRNVTKSTKTIVELFKTEIDQYYDNNGFLSWSNKRHKYVILGTNSPKEGICQCPECNSGQLMVIKSFATKKRFIGCSNYYNGCKASSPLLQKAMLRVLKTKCEVCTWPKVVFRYSRKQKWQRQCSNINCKSRKVNA